MYTSAAIGTADWYTINVSTRQDALVTDETSLDAPLAPNIYLRAPSAILRQSVG